MPIGAAIGGGLGAIGSIGSAFIGSNASSRASNQQAQAQMQALQLQSQMFAAANNALSPYYTAGQHALPTLEHLLTPSTSADTLRSLPGFQFQSQWGNLQATNALAAQGLGGSTGPLATAISNYNEGLAGTYWQNAVGGLENFANMGAGSANALAGTAVNSGNAMAGLLTGAGNALASGTLGSANAISGGLGGATGSISNALLLSGLMNRGGGGIYGGATSGAQAPY